MCNYTGYENSKLICNMQSPCNGMLNEIQAYAIAYVRRSTTYKLPCCNSEKKEKSR